MSVLIPPKNIPIKVYEKLIFIFLDEVTIDFNLLKVASHNNNWLEVKRISHKIGGVASSYGAFEVKDLTTALEISINSGDTNKDCIEKLELVILDLTKYIYSTYVQPSN